MVLYQIRNKVLFILISILLVFPLVINAGLADENQPSTARINKATAYDQIVSVDEDNEIEIKLDATGPEGVELTYGIAARSSHGKLSDIKNNVVTYRPYRDYYGTDKFEFSVYSRTPRLSSNYATVSITVSPVPDKPFAQDVEVFTIQNAPVEIDLVGFDPDGDGLKYSIKNRPENGNLELIDEPHNIYRYMPKTDFCGKDNFTFDANDGNNISNKATVNINVLNLSEVPMLSFGKSTRSANMSKTLKVEKPVDIVIDDNDNLYILSSPAKSKSQVLVCDLDLQVQQSFVVESNESRGIAVSDKKLIYITDTVGNRIMRYFPDGKPDISFGNQGSIGKSGCGDGEFDRPWGIGVDREGNIYISDSDNNRVQVLDSSGKYKSQWQQKTDYNRKPHNENLTIRDERDEKMYAEMLSHPRHISGFDQLRIDDRVPIKKPKGLFIEGGYLLFLADADNHKIKRFSAESGYLYSACGKKGSEPGCFNLPVDVSYDYEMDQLVVADSGNNRIEILQLQSYGEFFRTDAMTCVQEISDQQLSNPLGVAVVTKQPDQFIYIADTGNDRVLKLQNGFSKSGKSPVDVWEQFKAALLANDIDKALTFISEWKKDDYAEILKSMRPQFKKFVEDMGDLIPSSQSAGSASYELTATDPNGDVFSFPVRFELDDNGDWKITVF